MVEPGTLALFLVAVLALFLSPGPNMAFVLSHGVAHGTRGGFAAAIGIALADGVHTLCTATGITALIAAWPPSFDVLRYAGAMYLAWLALQALRSGKTQSDPDFASAEAPLCRIVRSAWLNNLVNPKALLFFMVFLPQFVDAGRGSLALQLVQLGLLLSLSGLAFNTLLGAGSGHLVRWLKQMPGAARLQRTVLASVMLCLAIRLLVLDRPSTLSPSRGV